MKSLAERPKSRVVEWVIKLIVFNAALTAAWQLYVHGLLEGITLPSFAVYILYLLGNAAFVLYDFGFSKLIGAYFARIKGRKKREL